jgi:hypothetical protein
MGCHPGSPDSGFFGLIPHGDLHIRLLYRFAMAISAALVIFTLGAAALPGAADAVQPALGEGCQVGNAELAAPGPASSEEASAEALVPCAALESGDFGNACLKAQPVMSARAGFLLCLIDLDVAQSESPPKSTLDPRTTHQNAGHGFGSAGGSACLNAVFRYLPCARLHTDPLTRIQRALKTRSIAPPDPSG